MKCVYVYASQNNDELSKNSVGVLKKIFSQYEVFKDCISKDFEIRNVLKNQKHNKIQTFFLHLFSKNIFDFEFINFNSYDCIYIRRLLPNNFCLLHTLKKIKYKNPSCKIVYEIPTYPYDMEHKGLSGKMFLLIDKFYRRKLHKYVDRIATLTDDKEIFGCKTLKITNGVDCSSIPVCKKGYFDNNNINLVAVAQFSFWHGYERVIEGLAEYKKSNVFLHLVGNGDELEKYKSLVKKYCLENQVYFYGALSGDELTSVFDRGDIAVSSLGCHRIGIYEGSFLKSREYLCRGLPMITSTKIDILSDDFKYCLRVPENDSPLNIEEIVTYVNSLYKDCRNNVSEKIRKFAEINCSMQKAMMMVVEYINS